MKPATTLLGVSLKMYFTHRQAIDWCGSVAELAGPFGDRLPEGVEVFVMPSFVSLPGAAAQLENSTVGLGAQDLHWEDYGAFTGEISPVELRDIGCSYVEVGHAERRSIFGESDKIVADKTAAALRNGLTPVLCIGEPVNGEPAAAIAECLRQLHSALDGQFEHLSKGVSRLVVAYEPVWAIGAATPASEDHIRTVCGALRSWLHDRGIESATDIIYGGSAGPGLLSRLWPSVDGLFLGRFAHDTESLAAIIAEAAALNEFQG